MVLYQSSTCWFNVFLWKQCNLWHFFLRHCLGKICCTSFYPWKLPFPPQPCGWPSPWSLAPLRVASVLWSHCFPPQPKIHCGRLWFCLVPDLFLLPRMICWLPVLPHSFKFCTTFHGARCFLFISFSTVVSRSHYGARIFLIIFNMYFFNISALPEGLMDF